MAEPQGSDAGSYKCVFIPADPSVPMEEQEIRFRGDEHAVRSMLDHAKAHYRRQRPPLSAAQREAAQRHFLAQVPEESRSRVTPEMLAHAVDLTSVESVGLLNHTPASAYVGINMYCDDKAGLEGQAIPNPRASDIARCCGKLLQVNGDAFLGRVFDNEEGFRRLDFTLADVGSSAPWVQEAHRQSQKRQQQDSSEAVLGRWKAQQGQQAGPTSKAPAEPQSHTRVVEEEAAPPSAAEAAKEEGNAAFKAGRLEEAVAAYTRALEAHPTFAAARSNRALVYLRLHRYKEAEEDCSAVLAAEPGSVKALLRRAAAREALKEGEKAAEDYRAAARLEPRNKEARAGLQRLGPAKEADAGKG